MAATTAWAGTPIGQRALALDQKGALSMLLDCSGSGWKISKDKGRTACFPAQGAGWYLD
jgi:hypothetical protein